MSIVIGSFNIRDLNFSNESKDGETQKRDFPLIADMIIKEGFDVVAIQEVNAPMALERIVFYLNKKKNLLHEWECDASGKAATTNNDPEGYGFIWNKKRIRLMDISRKNNPTFYNCAGGKNVIRPPYYGRFTTRGLPGGSNCEIRLVNTHIHDASRELERIAEFDVLVKQVLPRICDHNELPVFNEMMPAYTFLLGDYNLRLDKGERADVRIESITPTLYTNKKRYYKTVQEEKTSLKTIKMIDQDADLRDCYKSNYDHFTYEFDLIRKLKLHEERVEALGKYFGKEKSAQEILQLYREKVSDHVPIKMTVDLK